MIAADTKHTNFGGMIVDRLSDQRDQSRAYGPDSRNAADNLQLTMATVLRPCV
jgi:hypothetical protein